jgi:hypothetical protein
MTFQDMRNVIVKAKAELHEDIASLEARVNKSNATLYKEIREVNRKLDLIMKALDTVEINQEHRQY